MEKIRRANRLFATDSLFLREHLLIPVTRESPFYENGERVTEPAPPSHRVSIGGMPTTREFSPGSPDEKKSFDEFLNRLDSSLADIKKHVEKTKENSEWVSFLYIFSIRQPITVLWYSYSQSEKELSTQFYSMLNPGKSNNETNLIEFLYQQKTSSL